ncbi:rhamnosyltransferase [Marinimicrobium koreense]|uniref:Rhamnosyltransferase n=1 Tax=Marinimicrobium koreense TaxID=306545 RepID=A0A3N1NXP3_9GAMM|nr:glycosyltransferase family 2 protein [Marinimicrobium koreense]ROQ20068.1 rhamnosyltransferase [Marinimicrobium koreense]
MPNTPNPAQPASGIDYDVLVCTYNGAEFIEEQLHSILRQQPAPKRVLISDDHSADNTRAIVNQVAQSSPIPIEIIDGPGRGVIRNVLTALPKTTADYVFLADQDDIWLDNKVALFAEKMHSEHSPHLIFSDAWVWHPDREEKHSFWELDQLRPDNARDPRRLAFHNTVQGASACVNRSLIAAMEPTAEHPDIVMHDWWLALIASGTGHIDYIREPTLLYRQHDNNQVGSQNKAGRKNRSLSHRRAIATRILRQAAAFADHYGDGLPLSCQGFFKHYRRALRGNIIQRGTFILRHWPKHRDMRHHITLWASIVLAKGVKPE